MRKQLTYNHPRHQEKSSQTRPSSRLWRSVELQLCLCLSGSDGQLRGKYTMCLELPSFEHLHYLIISSAGLEYLLRILLGCTSLINIPMRITCAIDLVGLEYTDQVWFVTLSRSSTYLNTSTGIRMEATASEYSRRPLTSPANCILH
jgi:hypothetical protein